MNIRISLYAERIRQSLKWGRATISLCTWEIILGPAFQGDSGSPRRQRALLWCGVNCRAAYHDIFDPWAGWGFRFECPTDTANFVLAEQSGAF